MTERPPAEVLDVIGVPAAGPSALDESARAVLTSADAIIGAPRLLAALADSRAELIPLPSPLRSGLTELIRRNAGRRMALLASGDPLVAGIGSTVIELFGADQVRIHPAISSVALARARMGWSAETSDVIRPGPGAYEVFARCRPGARLVVLSRDQNSPGEIADRLVEAGLGASRMILFADLGTDAEQRFESRADAWTLDAVPALQLVCVDCQHGSVSERWSTVPGLPDEAFEHDGQLTKRYLRSAALARLRPLPGELLWDLGAGAGSVAIEWCRQHPTNRAVAVERNEGRAVTIAGNAHRLGVPTIEVVAGPVADALDRLPEPDAVFIGGGATAEVIERSWSALPRGGRLVAHAVTVETESLLIEAAGRHGGDLTRIGVETLEPLGRHHGWKPARPVTEWAATR